MNHYEQWSALADTGNPHNYFHVIASATLDIQGPYLRWRGIGSVLGQGVIADDRRRLRAQKISGNFGLPILVHHVGLDTLSLGDRIALEGWLIREIPAFDNNHPDASVSYTPRRDPDTGDPLNPFTDLITPHPSLTTVWPCDLDGNLRADL